MKLLIQREPDGACVVLEAPELVEIPWSIYRQWLDGGHGARKRCEGQGLYWTLGVDGRGLGEVTYRFVYATGATRKREQHCVLRRDPPSSAGWIDQGDTTKTG